MKRKMGNLPKMRTDPVAAEIQQMRCEILRLGEIVLRMERTIDLAVRPTPEPVDPDPPVGVVSAAELSGKSAKVLRRLIDTGVPIGEYVAATDRYVVRMGALTAYLKDRAR
jgi:hypothetical protein